MVDGGGCVKSIQISQDCFGGKAGIMEDMQAKLARFFNSENPRYKEMPPPRLLNPATKCLGCAEKEKRIAALVLKARSQLVAQKEESLKKSSSYISINHDLIHENANLLSTVRKLQEENRALKAELSTHQYLLERGQEQVKTPPKVSPKASPKVRVDVPRRKRSRGRSSSIRMDARRIAEIRRDHMATYLLKP